VLLLTTHGQEGVPLDRDAGGVQRVGERAGGTGRDVIRGQSDVHRHVGASRRVVSVCISHVRHLVLQRDIDLRLKSHGKRRTLTCLTTRRPNDFSRRSLPCDVSRRRIRRILTL